MRSVSIVCLLAASAIAHAAEDDIRLSAQTAGAAVRIEAKALLRAPLAIVWQTLTDYDHLESFIPGMAQSRVILRRGVASITLVTKPLLRSVAEAQFRGMVSEIRRRSAASKP